MTLISVWSGLFEEGVELILSDKDQKWSGIKEYTKGI